MPESEQQSHKPESADQLQRRSGQSWESYIDEQIRAAQERGDFERLPGAGRPLTLDVNPFAGERALAFSLLKGQGVAPQEVELGREIDRDRQHAESLIAALRRRRDNLRQRRMGPFASERRAYHVQVQRVLRDYEALMRATNSKALSLNIIAPLPLHRAPVDVESRLAALRDEFPPLAE